MSPVQQDSKINGKALWVLLVGVFLISFSVLALEISLTRVLSVMMSYHYVFIVVSLALLGLGTGGIIVHLCRLWLARWHSGFSSLVLLSSLFAFSIPALTIAATRITTGSILLYGFLLFIPFFFAGMLLAQIFSMFPTLSSRIYGADLIGAAIGSLVVVFMLNTFGGIYAVLGLSLVGLAAVLLYVTLLARLNPNRMVLAIVSFLIVSSLLGTSFVGSRLADVPIGIDATKEMQQALDQTSTRGEIVETRWSAFGRTDLVGFRNDPGQMAIYIDGTSGTPMYRFNGNFNKPDPAIGSLKTGFPGYLPLSYLKEDERGNALIIGPGGGRDILLALMAGIGKVTAVEVNKELVDIMREYAWYNGGIYTGFDNVSVYVDEGRSFLKRQTEKYDIIMLSLPVTKTSRSLEGYALTENFLFTTDSINDYLEHLTDEGRLIVVAHDPVEILKLLSISMTALNQRSVADETAMNQIYIVGSHHFPVFVLKKTPFEPAEMVSIHQSIHQLGYEPTLSYLPTIKWGGDVTHVEKARFDECAMLFPPVVAISRGEIGLSDIERVLQENSLDISPVSDDSPFFYKFEKGIPQAVSTVFWSSAIMLLLTLLTPLIHQKIRGATSKRGKIHREDRGLSNRNLTVFAVFFSMLGIGFMLVEISAIQRFTLFLGQPVLSLSVLLFSLLVGAGTGSIYSGRFSSAEIKKAIAIFSLSIATVLVIYTFSLPILLRQFLGFELAVRLIATIALLVPLGFLMGLPFPLGLRLIKEMKMEACVPWLWGINGVASVLGSAMTIVIALSYSFTWALLLGASCYFVAFLMSRMTGYNRGLATREVMPKD